MEEMGVVGEVMNHVFVVLGSVCFDSYYNEISE